MEIELRPLGVKCNLQCQYCYQNPQRDAGNVLQSYNIAKMKIAVERAGGPFILFGGEPLMVQEKDLEELWSWGFQKYGSNGIQTNGTLINDNHIRMFKKYRVHVGISVDGPGELNDARWAGTLERTREGTAKTHSAIEQLSKEGMAPSLIITLHRANATTEKLPTLHDWLRHVEAIGVTSARLHILETEDEYIRIKYALSTDENLAALLSFAKLEEELTTLKLDMFHDMRRLLTGEDSSTSCIWNACDPYTTRAVQGVEGNGQSSNCGRTNKDGIDFTKSANEGFERYLALYHTPQEYGGCKGCRFFLMCKGQCPGTAIDNDWRNRTEHCKVWKGLYRHLEEKMLRKGITPLSVAPIRKRLEEVFLDTWAAGQNTTIAHGLKRVHADRSATTVGRQTFHEDRKDRDSPHLDSFGDQPTLDNQATSPCAASVQHSKLMERLGYVLPDFTRICWVSDGAKAVWEPRLRRITEAWFEIEWLSVATGIRACAATLASPEDFLARARRWTELGLTALPLEIEGVSNYFYSSTAKKPEPGKPFVFRIVLGKPSDVLEFKKAWNAHDDREIGRLLGYPRCCFEFFKRIWVEEGLVDTTWPMAVETTICESGATTIEITGQPQANILWRWMGARAVPHLPCRFDCKETVELGNQLLTLGRESGYASEMDWLSEILLWPVEWSALHGIAEVKTPVLKLSTQTDATSRKYVVRLKGNTYPSEGAQGLTFPYRAPRSLFLTHSGGFQRGLDHPIGPHDGRSEWYAADNGFDSVVAMDNAQKAIVDLATAVLSGKRGAILDLGCGNGALLKKIHEANPHTIPFGIDLQSSRVEHARLLHPEFAENFTVGDMFENAVIWAQGRQYTLAILMPGRLVEAGPQLSAKLKDRLKQNCDQLLVYAWEGWLTRYHSLQSLVSNVGIVLFESNAAVTASIASVR